MSSEILVPLILLALILAYRWKKNRAKKSIAIQEKPAYVQILEKEVAFFQKLDEIEKEVFVKKVQTFLDRVRIEGVKTEVNETDRVLVAASAIIPIFNFGNWMYRNLTSVILYPDTFNNEYQFEGEDRSIMGMVGNGFMNGQMLLSKTALYAGFKAPTDARNTAIHEFVHLLDGSDGGIDGLPELLLDNASSLPWIKAMETEIRRIERGQSDIDTYAVTSEAEFFAVVAEYFFENPSRFREKHPRLYRLMDKMFNPENNPG